MPILAADRLTVGYPSRSVITDLNLTVPHGRITGIVGPNACGKSTLLRGLANLTRPSSGVVTLDGTDIQRMESKTLARALGLLPQSPLVPEALTVRELVRRGRYPHQRPLRPLTGTDHHAVDTALQRTGLVKLADRPVDELSGGQRQRAWIALALAQQTPLLLLDEPTTYLDLRHQLDVLDLLADLNAADHRTIVMVLHDLNQAARYCDHLIVIANGQIVATGAPAEVLTAELVHDVFGVPCQLIADPLTGTPLVVPIPRRTARTPDTATPSSTTAE